MQYGAPQYSAILASKRSTTSKAMRSTKAQPPPQLLDQGSLTRQRQTFDRRYKLSEVVVHFERNRLAAIGRRPRKTSLRISSHFTPSHDPEGRTVYLLQPHRPFLFSDAFSRFICSNSLPQVLGA